MRGSGERWLPHLVGDEASAIAARLEAWATVDTIAALREAVPAIPLDLRDRHAETWWSMFAIADAAGGAWPERARRAALVLHASRDEAETMSLKVLLLAHVRAAFEEASTDRLATAALLHLLVQNEEGPWGRFWGAELNRDGAPRAAATDLARHLRPFGVKPRVIKLADGSTSRGYRLDDLEDAFERYLSPSSMGDVTDATNVTPLASAVTSVTSVTGGTEGTSDAEPGEGCVRCARYGPDHEGEHRASWESSDA